MKINAILLGQIIRDVRTASDLSTNTFAKEVGVPQSALSRMEKPPRADFRVSYDTLVSVLEYASNLDVVKNHDIDFSKYKSEEDAEDTIELFLSFKKNGNLLGNYIAAKNDIDTSFINENMVELERPFLAVLEDSLRFTKATREVEKIVVDAKNRPYEEMNELFNMFIQQHENGKQGLIDEDSKFDISLNATDKAVVDFFMTPSLTSIAEFTKYVVEVMTYKPKQD